MSSINKVRPVVRLTSQRKICVQGYELDEYDSTVWHAREIRMYYRWLRGDGVTRFTARAVISGLLMLKTTIQRSDDE